MARLHLGRGFCARANMSWSNSVTLSSDPGRNIKTPLRAAARGRGGESMTSRNAGITVFVVVLACVAELPATAQSFRVQCPTSTITHPSSLNNNNAEPAYTGPTTLTLNGNGFFVPAAKVNGAIKCQQVSGGDGYSTMADGTQTFMFSFGPLSGLADIANGKPGTQFPSIFNTTAPAIPVPGDPATSDGVMANSWPGFPLPTAG